MHVLLLSSCLLATDVIVVDAGGGGDFLDPASAIAAANEGDTILIESGFYAAIDVVGKSLDLVADEGRTVQLLGLRVADLAVGQSVSLRGLDVPSASGLQSAALVIESCAGAVVVENSTLRGREVTAFTEGTPSVIVVDSDRVHLVDCVLEASDALFLIEVDGDDGLWVDSSHVIVHGCRIEGGSGRAGFGPTPAGRGGDSLSAIDSTVEVLDSELLGGPGGAGGSPAPPFFLNCTDGGLGGTAAVASDSTLLLREAQLIPGPAGLATDPNCGDGVVGTAFELIAASQLIDLGGTQRRLEVLPSPVRAGSNFTLRAEGEPGDVVVWAASLAADPSALLLPQAPGFVLVLGTLDASGLLELSVPLGPFAPTVESVALFEQTLHVTPTFAFELSEPRRVVHLAVGF